MNEQGRYTSHNIEEARVLNLNDIQKLERINMKIDLNRPKDIYLLVELFKYQFSPLRKLEILNVPSTVKSIEYYPGSSI